jgi:RNA polymerase sigma-70 factor, ECF subfamily
MSSVSQGSVARVPEDHARLERMFAAYHSTVWRILCRRGLSPDVAADAMQETFVIAVERLHEIQPNSERAFLIQTAMRVAHTLGRKTWRWQLEGDMDQRCMQFRDTGDQRANIQLCDLVLSKVHPQLVEVFVLYEIEELSAAEIATLLDIPPGSVASRLRRARKEFRTVLETVERAMRREGQS